MTPVVSQVQNTLQVPWMMVPGIVQGEPGTFGPLGICRQSHTTPPTVMAPRLSTMTVSHETLVQPLPSAMARQMPYTPGLLKV